MPPKMSRLGVYAALSTALAGGVVVAAFHQRPNFYSACVYLAQSNLCLMILINLILLIYASLVYGLQRLCYGPLRPIEIEQLYEKGWFAVTETCLAMTIFREEVGAWFLVMFVALLTGKVWGWIGDGRVEVLEQQPPANPRLFHIRLSVSLAMSVVYDLWLMQYTINTVVQQARPNMMVMFLFEFAVLSTSSLATTSRYIISLTEARIVKKQTQERLDERRREVREERIELVRQRAAAMSEGTSSETDDAPLPSEEDVDEMDIEVQGWEAKGQWVLTLDLITDFLKLLIYVTFFIILMVFYGLPIHIIRDLVMTLRSFIKRLTAFLRYRRATQNMNLMYGDATAEDIQREDTCIICREEMRPWAVTNPPAVPGQPAPRPTGTVNERQRPKKLPCGHILHLGCLKSWLERQQACPTCRASVVTTAPTGAPQATNVAQGVGEAAPVQANGAPVAGAQRPQMRMFNLGPLRLGFGQGNLRDVAGNAAGVPPGGPNNNRPAGPRIYGLELGFPGRQQGQAQVQPQAEGQAQNPVTTRSRSAARIQNDLGRIEAEINLEISRLQINQQQLNLVNLLQAELARLRLVQAGASDPLAPHQHAQFNPLHNTPHLGQHLRPPTRSSTPIPTPSNTMERHTVRPGTVPIPSGSTDLPVGVTIPDGWSLLPLHREGLPRSPPNFNQATSGNSTPTGSATVGLPNEAGIAPQDLSTQIHNRVHETAAIGTSSTITAPAPQQPSFASQQNSSSPSLSRQHEDGRETRSEVHNGEASAIQNESTAETDRVASNWSWVDEDDGDGDEDDEEDEDGSSAGEKRKGGESSDLALNTEPVQEGGERKGKTVSMEDVDDEDA